VEDVVKAFADPHEGSLNSGAEGRVQHVIIFVQMCACFLALDIAECMFYLLYVCVGLVFMYASFMVWAVDLSV
jgi:hypothetical protein